MATGRVELNGVMQMVVDALLSNAAVQAAVGNRITGGWTAAYDLGTVPKPAIVVVGDGGEAVGIAAGRIARLSLEVWALSAVGTAEAAAVYELAADALHQEALCHATNGHRGACVETERPRQGQVDAASVWYAAGRFLVTASRS